MQTITTIGPDIAKSVFQVHCVDAVDINIPTEIMRTAVAVADVEDNNKAA
jgi:hypothetical protein